MSFETFGRAISLARRGKGLSQKELAELIKLDDNGQSKSISPQYLNDIEHNRRNPSSSQLVAQFAKVLELDADYLSFLADCWPDSLRKQIKSQDQFTQAFALFRKAAKGNK